MIRKVFDLFEGLLGLEAEEVFGLLLALLHCQASLLADTLVDG